MDIEGEWLNVTPDLDGIEEQNCGPALYISSKPDEDQVIVNIAGNGLWATEDGGESWRILGQSEGSAVINNGAVSIVYDPENPDVYWESGAYGGGVFRTEDGGESFVQLGDIMHCDGVSIDFSDPDRRTLLAAGHEQDVLYLSRDGGDTWEDIAPSIPAEAKQCRFSLILDTDTFLIGCGGYYDPGEPGTYRSADGGETWEKVHDNGGGAEPLVTSDGTIYWPEEFENGLARSTDSGETWETVTGPKKLLPVKPVELPDGRLASLTENAVVVSDDQGATWVKVSPPTPFKPVGFTYSPFQKAFFIFQFLCNNMPTPARGDEVQRFDFDFETL
jgi:photosystem II stability/assembly factor-like uncharacterized protein